MLNCRGYTYSVRDIGTIVVEMPEKYVSLWLYFGNIEILEFWMLNMYSYIKSRNFVFQCEKIRKPACNSWILDFRKPEAFLLPYVMKRLRPSRGARGSPTAVNLVNRCTKLNGTRRHTVKPLILSTCLALEYKNAINRCTKSI